MSNDTIKLNTRVQIGKVFDTYESFEKDMKLYCEETSQLFVVVKSEIVNESIKFRVFKCCRHDKPSSRGKNERELQSYNGCNCILRF